MIPKIVHFVFGFKEQTEEFHFIYAMAIASAKIMINPEKIYFWYHHEPYGRYWDFVKGFLTMEKVDIPKNLLDKPVKKHQHSADIVRLDKISKYGGIYLDIDTICVRPIDDFLSHDIVIGQEKNYGLCNAIMMAHKDSKFLRDWSYAYYVYFNSESWAECSVRLPKLLSLKNTYENSLFAREETFLKPSYNEVHLIFNTPGYEIPKDLRILHLWYSVSVWNELPWWNDFTTLEKCLSSDTLYGRLVRNLGEENLRAIFKN